MIVSLLLPSAMSPERRGVPSFLHGSQRYKSKDGRDADTVTKADPARRGSLLVRSASNFITFVRAS